MPELDENGLPADPNWVPPRTPAALDHLGRESEKRLAKKMRPFKNAGLDLISNGSAKPRNVMQRMFELASGENPDAKPGDEIRAAEFLRDTLDGRPEQQVEVDTRKVEAKVLVIRDERAKLLPRLERLAEAVECEPKKDETPSDSKSSEFGE